MTRQRIAIVALGVAAASSCAMAGYHFALPFFIWHWSRFVGGIPATIRWGLFAINMFFSFLLLAGGVLTAVAARKVSRGAAPDRGVLIAMAGFWALNMLYQVVVPMPLPSEALAAAGATAWLRRPDVARRTSSGCGFARTQTRMNASDAFATFEGEVMRPVVIAAVWAIGVTAGSIPAVGQGVPGIIYAEQPAGIEIATYLATWPALEPEIHRLSAERAAVMPELARRAAQHGISDGALNLLAQLQRENGALDDAEKSINQAIAMQPKQFLHHFQHAMILFAHLTRASELAAGDGSGRPSMPTGAPSS